MPWNHRSTRAAALRSCARIGCLLAGVTGAGCRSADAGRTAAALNGSSGLVIRQVFGGGGNGGAVLTYDYVELFNRGAAPVKMEGWSIQYASAPGTGWGVHALPTATVEPGRYYLVQLASQNVAVGAALPVSADSVGLATGTGAVNLGASNGKVALVSSATPLTCGTNSNRCSSVASVVDLIGYGTAADYEGSAAASALSTNAAAVRGSGGCGDSDDSKADFATATWSAGPTGPALHNSASPASLCFTPPDLATGPDLAAGGDLATPPVDLAGADLSGTQPDLSAPTDLGTGPDLAGADLAGSPDLATPPDLAAGPDLATPPDLAPVPDLALPPADMAASTAGVGWIVISQLYGAGGNSGAKYKNDYIELFNRGTTTVSIGNWSVQYGSAPNNFSQRANLPEGLSLEPGQYFLVQLAGGSNGVDLPVTADLVITGTAAFNLSASNGKVAVVASTALVGCGAAASRCNSPLISDLVGYGTAADFEGTAAKAPGGATQALYRKSSGCVDSASNVDDLESSEALPRNRATTPFVCAGGAADAAAHDAAVADLAHGASEPGADLATGRGAGGGGGETSGGGGCDMSGGGGRTNGATAPIALGLILLCLGGRLRRRARL